MSFGGDKKGGSTIASESTQLRNPITFYRDRTGKYPSNAQIWWSMKRPPEVGTDRPPKTYLEVFDPGLRYQVAFGNTPVPKGHYIIDAFQQDRSGSSGIPNIPVKTSQGARPAAVAFFAGRVFYSGPFAPEFNTKIYFSPIIERPEQIGQCFQEFDPTSEEIRDLLPSDGGVIVIPEVTQVFHMVPYGNDLFVFADNGVFAVSGGQSVGFTASDYSVRKVSGSQTISNLSFVLVEGVPIWWNRSGIYTLGSTEQGGLAVQSLTEDSIKTFYEDIPEQSKVYAKGAYDPRTKIVQYLYRSTAAETEAELFQYDSILLLNTRTGAWMPWMVAGQNRVSPMGIFTIEGETTSSAIARVLVGVDEVVAGADDVYSILTFQEVLESKIKYIINILDDITDVPLPPDPVPISPLEVFVFDDRVAVNTDLVIINP